MKLFKFIFKFFRQERKGERAQRTSDDSYKEQHESEERILVIFILDLRWLEVLSCETGFTLVPFSRNGAYLILKSTRKLEKKRKGNKHSPFSFSPPLLGPPLGTSRSELLLGCEVRAKREDLAILSTVS